jgi:hypothetical protein
MESTTASGLLTASLLLPERPYALRRADGASFESFVALSFVAFDHVCLNLLYFQASECFAKCLTQGPAHSRVAKVFCLLLWHARILPTRITSIQIPMTLQCIFT